MPTESSGYNQRPWPGTFFIKDRASQFGSAEGRATASKDRDHHTRSAVSWHEKLLLGFILLIAAGWVIYRLLVTLLTAG